MSDMNFNPTGVNWAGSHYGTVRFGEDNQKVVVFYVRSTENPAKSKEVGTRFFQNDVFIRIHEPGERLNIVDRPVQEADKDRFPIQWSRFVQNKAQVPEGTLVDLLFPNNPAVADNLKASGIYTVQQLAKLSANAIDSVGMGAQEWVNMAQAYLKNASDGSAFLRLQDDMKDLKQTIKIKDDQIAKLLQQVNTLIAATRNPDFNKLQPGFIPGYDVQSDRINDVHVTKDISRTATKGKKKVSVAPPQDEIEQYGMIDQNAKD